MPDLPSPPAALRRRAAADPESPFLFWPEGWNWRWWSWRQVAEQMDRWRPPLATLPPGAMVGFEGGAYPDAIPLDLAVQEAGMTTVPLAGGQVGKPEGPAVEASEEAAECCDTWLELVAGEPRVRQLGVPRPASPSGRAAPGGPCAGDGAGGGAGEEAADRSAGKVACETAGGVMVTGPGGGRSWLAAADVAAAALRVESAIAAVGPPRAGGGRARQILVAGQPLGEWPARLLTTWAILAGAALVLQSEPALRLGTVRWARPTVFHGSAAEIAALRQELEKSWPPHQLRRWGKWRRRTPRAPLGRLVILFQSEAPAPDDLAFWQEYGARLLQLPSLVTSSPRGSLQTRDQHPDSSAPIESIV